MNRAAESRFGSRWKNFFTHPSKDGPARGKARKQQRASYARWPLAASVFNTTNHYLISPDINEYDKAICKIFGTRVSVFVPATHPPPSCRHWGWTLMANSWKEGSNKNRRIYGTAYYKIQQTSHAEVSQSAHMRPLTKTNISKTMVWVSHVASTSTKRQSQKISEDKRAIGRRCCRWDNNIKIYLTERVIEKLT